LKKIDEGKLQVAEMSAALEIKKEVVSQSQKDCEELLVFLVSERRVADEQKKQVEADAERIGKEEEACNAESAKAQAELDIAMPALNAALEEVEKLDKSAITEIKSFNKPPPQVETVLAAVMVLFGLSSDWKTSKKKISEPDFLKQVTGYNKDNISAGIIAKIKRYVTREDFTKEAVFTVSSAASALCVWVHAMYNFAQGNIIFIFQVLRCNNYILFSFSYQECCSNEGCSQKCSRQLGSQASCSTCRQKGA
jgi:dynein heavy chain